MREMMSWAWLRAAVSGLRATRNVTTSLLPIEPRARCPPSQTRTSANSSVECMDGRFVFVNQIPHALLSPAQEWMDAAPKPLHRELAGRQAKHLCAPQKIQKSSTSPQSKQRNKAKVRTLFLPFAALRLVQLSRAFAHSGMVSCRAVAVWSASGPVAAAIGRCASANPKRLA